MTDTVSTDTQSFREQALAVTIHRACPCGAPGVYHSDEWIMHQYAGCWVACDDPRVGQPVGDVCPHCNKSRAPSLIEHVGEIWRKIFRK